MFIHVTKTVAGIIMPETALLLQQVLARLTLSELKRQPSAQICQSKQKRETQTSLQASVVKSYTNAAYPSPLHQFPAPSKALL